MPKTFQTIEAGQTLETPAIEISEQDILEFAAEFDPQPYHLDRAAADASIFGGLCASGWQVCAVMMRLLSDSFRNADIALLGVQGVPEMRWKIPVFAGDQLTGRIEIIATESDSKRADAGRVRCKIDVRNQKDQSVMLLTSDVLVPFNEQVAR